MQSVKLAATAVVCALLSACNAYGGRNERVFPMAQEPWAAFDEVALKAGIAPGHAIVRGQAFSKTVGGDVKYGAGNDILIVPNTEYASQCIALLSAAPGTTCVVKIKPYVRTVKADGEGRFEVTDLKPGSYVLSTIISWGVPGPYGVETTGGAVTVVVDVKSDTDVVTTNLN